MQSSTKLFVLTVATAAVAATSVVYAFQGPVMGTGFGPMGHGPGSSGPGARFAHPEMSSYADQRIGDLKNELKITAAQESAWTAFASKAKEQAQTMQARRAKMQESAGPTPDRMAQRAEFMKQRMVSMESMNAAMKDLYAVLTPEQKALADQRFGGAGTPRMPFGPRGG
ncbi:MAG: Spy/CpxP family protein refolding chaperone [Hydrogenophaga sp.]|uniref:Spy/CpxP family protein refolding chaperone n=1 Tax=Hydrogenophaga sp. TaxID=1904254 RepID=UPI003D0CBF2B